MQMREAFGVDLVDAPGAPRAIEYQPGIFQQTQMLGNGRAGKREMPRQFSDRLGLVQQLQQDGSASGVSKSIQLRIMVSVHLR